MNATISLINALRCWRCGDLPAPDPSKGTGLSCRCRGYTLSVGAWIAQCACKDREPQALPIGDKGYYAGQS